MLHCRGELRASGLDVHYQNLDESQDKTFLAGLSDFVKESSIKVIRLFEPTGPKVIVNSYLY